MKPEELESYRSWITEAIVQLNGILSRLGPEEDKLTHDETVFKMLIEEAAHKLLRSLDRMEMINEERKV